MNTQPKGYLLLHNIQKRKNMIGLIQSAIIFGFERVFILDKNELITEEDSSLRRKRLFLKEVTKDFISTDDYQQLQSRITFQYFKDIHQAKSYFVDNNIQVCGIEIASNSKNIALNSFSQSTAFFPGNEGSGLNKNHRKICDIFVYVPQYSNKTASLNVACASSVVFHHFAEWSQNNNRN